jgi:hypothetical protein
MSAQNTTQEPTPTVPTSQGLISIERVVAFVLGPIVVAASGTISAAAIKWGFNVTPKAIEGAFITGGLAAGAAVWKWLQGRQKTPILLNDGKHVLNTVTGVVEDLGITHNQQQSIERQVLGVLEEHAHNIANMIASKVQMAGTEIHITNPTKTNSAPSAEATKSVETSGQGSQVTAPTEPEPPIETLEEAGDPAPATPVPATPAPPAPTPVAPPPPTAPVQPPTEPMAPPTPPAGVGG